MGYPGPHPKQFEPKTINEPSTLEDAMPRDTTVFQMLEDDGSLQFRVIDGSADL